MFRVNGVIDDAIRLRLFSFSLKDKAKAWLNSLPAGSITNWATLAQFFFAKYSLLKLSSYVMILLTLCNMTRS